MAHRQMHGILRLEKEGQMLTELELAPGRPVILGRSEQAEVRVDHGSVSRRHARLWIDAEGAFLEDLGSANGTLLEGRAIEQKVAVSDGQAIQLGQRTVAEPVTIRFEDPAAGVLREMGLWDTASVDDGSESGAGEDPEGGTDPVGAVSENTAAGEALGAKPPDAGERRVGEELRDPRVLAILAVGLLVVGLASFGVLRFLRPSATYWRSVQINPAEIGPDVEVRLSSFDIGRGKGLELALGNVAVEELQVERGHVIFRAPQLETLGGGKLGLSLVARRRGVEVYQRVVTYNVVPQLEPLASSELAAGEILEITGRGFHQQADKVAVYFGEQPGKVLTSDLQAVRVRVPPVDVAEGRATAEQQVELRVEVDGLQATAPLPTFTVLPFAGQPLDLRLSAEHDPETGAWKLRHILGLAYHLSGPAPASDGAVPSVVAQEVERWNQLFEVVERDPRVRLVGRTASGVCELVAVGGAVGGNGLRVARFAPGELAPAFGSAAGETRAKTSTRNLCARTASVWDHFLGTFARGQEVRGLNNPPPYARALGRLVEASRWRGGEGRPSASDLAVLDAADQAHLAGAFLVPGG